MPDLPGPYGVFLRLMLALVFGAIVMWIYKRTIRGAASTSLPATLVLLAVLIAMVTQVVGDNVARAFSLVGALSIVRFRTVVRDTRDTAFVIFAVVAGMAAGAHNLAIGLIGLVITGAAAFALMGKQPQASAPFILRVKAAAGVDLEPSLAAILGPTRKLLCLGTAKQGASIEAVYEFPLDRPAQDLLRELNRIDGVQDIRLESRDYEKD